MTQIEEFVLNESNFESLRLFELSDNQSNMFHVEHEGSDEDFQTGFAQADLNEDNELTFDNYRGE